MIEQEYKWLVTPEKFNEVLGMLRSYSIPEKLIVQKNHYYAPQRQFNEGCTVRVRETDGTFVLQIKEQCDKQKGYRISEETHRNLTELPTKILPTQLGLGFSDEFYYIGYLTTYRHHFQLSENSCVDCDENEYLKTFDYEVEMEFENEAKFEVLNLLSDCAFNKVSKYQRFIRRLGNEKEDSY